MVLAAEFPAIPSSAVKIASERRCAILVHSGHKKGGFVCHKSRSSYAIKVGACTPFSVKVPLFQGIFMPYDPSFYGIFWGHFFANMGGGGGQNYFQIQMVFGLVARIVPFVRTACLQNETAPEKL